MNLDLLHFDRVGQKLTEKFDSPAGELNNKIRLNSRHQLLNESPIKFLDALIQLAHRTELDLPAQHAKIIEVMMEKTNDTGVREKIVKLLSKAQDKAWQPEFTWEQFEIQIKNLHRISNYAKNAELTQQAYAVNVIELAGKVKNLLSKDSPESKIKTNSIYQKPNQNTNQQQKIDNKNINQSRNFYPTRTNYNTYSRC